MSILNSLQERPTSYDDAITGFVEWYCSEPRLAFNRTVVHGLRPGELLSPVESRPQARRAESAQKQSGHCS